MGCCNVLMIYHLIYLYNFLSLHDSVDEVTSSGEGHGSLLSLDSDCTTADCSTGDLESRYLV